MRIRNLVVKTSGSIFDEFRQLICGHVVHSKFPKVDLKFITSEAFKSEFTEYFNLPLNTIEISDIVSTKYHYDPQNQDTLLNKLVAFEGESDDCIEYFIYEPTANEFKRADMNIFAFIKEKKKFLSELKESVHDYVMPQLTMLFEDRKINVGLLYDTELTTEVYSQCNKPDIFNYVDFTSANTIESKPYINKYSIKDEFLLFIALCNCDMIIGSWDQISYEAIALRNMMLLDVSRNSTKVETLIPSQTVFNQTTWFPNSQLLLEFI